MRQYNYRFPGKQKNLSTAWVFAGQGSQKLGMGLDLQRSALARQRFAKASQILGWSVLESCQNETKLSHTLYLQPCLYVVSSILIDLLKQKREYQPKLVAGYSLGEYMALYAAEVFDFDTGLYLLKRRGELMEYASKGTSVILIGADLEILKNQIQATANVWLINDDLANPMISGNTEAVESLLSKVKCRRVIRLKPNKAFHTPLIQSSALKFAEFLESIKFASAKIPVISSVELTPTVQADRLKKNLIKQITLPVYWRKVTKKLTSAGVEQVVDISPGKGLIKQMKKIDSSLIYTSISSLAEISLPRVAA